MGTYTENFAVIERYIRRRIGCNSTDAWQIVHLPLNEGGQGVPIWHLEVGVITIIRTVLHLLNSNLELGTEMRKYVSEETKWNTMKERPRITQAMRQLAPYGILFLDKKI